MISENLRNDLMSANDQLGKLDQQLIKDREKIVELREEKRILEEKVRYTIIYVCVCFCAQSRAAT